MPNRRRHHHGAPYSRNASRRQRRHRRRHRHIPPPAPAPVTGLHLPYDDAWRAYYNDTSHIRCGSFALCQMLSVHYGRTFDPEFVWDGIGATTGSSVWSNLVFAKAQGWVRDFRFFRDDGGRAPVELARDTLFAGLAFMVICNYFESGHIWCVTGIDDTKGLIYSPQDWGSPKDETVTFDQFNAMVLGQPPFASPPGYAICGVGLF